jgi:hypothetical protein
MRYLTMIRWFRLSQSKVLSGGAEDFLWASVKEKIAMFKIIEVEPLIVFEGHS